MYYGRKEAEEAAESTRRSGSSRSLHRRLHRNSAILRGTSLSSFSSFFLVRHTPLFGPSLPSALPASSEILESKHLPDAPPRLHIPPVVAIVVVELTVQPLNGHPRIQRHRKY